MILRLRSGLVWLNSYEYGYFSNQSLVKFGYNTETVVYLPSTSRDRAASFDYAQDKVPTLHLSLKQNQVLRNSTKNIYRGIEQ